MPIEIFYSLCLLCVCCCKLLKTELKKTRFTSLTDAHTVTRSYIFHSRVLLSPLENHRHDFRSKTCEINWCVLMARGVWKYPVYLFLYTVPLRAFTQTEKSFRLLLPKRKYIEHQENSGETRAQSSCIIMEGKERAGQHGNRLQNVLAADSHTHRTSLEKLCVSSGSCLVPHLHNCHRPSLLFMPPVPSLITGKPARN